MTKKNKSGSKAGKTVLITGATGGIGKAMAIKFAIEGWDVIGHFRAIESDAVLLKRAVERHGVDCHLLKADFALKNRIDRFIRDIKRFDIDALINNAATPAIDQVFASVSVTLSARQRLIAHRKRRITLAI